MNGWPYYENVIISALIIRKREVQCYLLHCLYSDPRLAQMVYHQLYVLFFKKSMNRNFAKSLQKVIIA